VRLHAEGEAAEPAHDIGGRAPAQRTSIVLPPPQLGDTHLFEGPPRKPSKEQKPAPKKEEKLAPKKEAEQAAVTSPYTDCAPRPATAAQLDAVKPNIFGHTGLGSVSPLETGILFDNNFCRTETKSTPSFALKDFMFAKEGDYPRGKESRDRAPCKGKQLDILVHITPEVSDRIRQGEVEHCNDIHRTFNLTYIPVWAAFTSMRFGVAAGDAPSCQKRVMELAQDWSGIEPSKVGDMFLCLFNKSKSRDDNHWHTLVWGQPETAKYSKDCKSVTYTPNVNALPEIGKHRTEDVVTGCGIKSKP
jgi:hypothetical protein